MERNQSYEMLLNRATGHTLRLPLPADGFSSLTTFSLPLPSGVGNILPSQKPLRVSAATGAHALTSLTILALHSLFCAPSHTIESMRSKISHTTG